MTLRRIRHYVAKQLAEARENHIKGRIGALEDVLEKIDQAIKDTEYQASGQEIYDYEMGKQQ